MPTGEIEVRWFRLMAENASDVVVMSDRDGRFEWVSPSCERTLGLSPADVVGHTAFDFVHPDDVDVLRAAQVHVLSGEEQRFELRMAHANGGWKWLSIMYRPVVDEAGIVIGRVCGWRDVNDQHRAQAALRDQEEQFRLLAEHASDVVVQGSADGVMEWVSPSVEPAIGRRVDDLLGRPFTDIVDERDLVVVHAAQDSVRLGQVAKFEARLLDAGSVPKWFAIVVTPIFDADGVLVGRIANWRDIDEQHRAQEALQKSEEQLRFIIEQASDLVVMQVEGMSTFVSPAITEMLGWQPDDLVGRLATEFWHPDDRATAVALRNRVQGGSTGDALMRMRHADGSYRWIEVTGRPAPTPDGRAGAVGVLRDVTARVEAERQREVLRERDRLMAEMSSDVFAVFNADGTIEEISGAVVQIAGREPADIIGVSGRELFLETDLLEGGSRRGLLERGELLRGLVRIRRPDGTTRWVDRRSRAVFDEHGQVQHFVSAWRDAQPEVEYGEALAAATEAAQAANLAKTTFLSRMSHELRTPLNAVLGFAQLLQMDDLNAEQQASVAQILGGGRHLLELINEVLDIARIESGRLTLSPERVLVSDVVIEALELMHPLAAQHEVTLDVFSADGCEDIVFVDRQRMIQILLNLLSNAVKYNRRGGSVHLTCDHAGDRVLLSVHDQGLGIAPEDLPKLFAPFERLGAAQKGVEGTGIGLALSRGLAEIMGAQLDVESTVGVGSTFTLALPRADGMNGPTAPDVTRFAAGQLSTATRLLYVEDNPANVTLMRSIVARRPNVEFTVAGTAEDALELASTQEFDLVLLDLHLPDASGEEVLRRLRTQATTATIPVVVLTADASSIARDRVNLLGGDAFLTKPVDVGEVLQWIDHPYQSRNEA